MPKTEYTNKDIKQLEYMDFETVLHQLNRIKCGYLPSGWKYPNANSKQVFTTQEYDATMLRQAMNVAMALVREKIEQEHTIKKTLKTTGNLLYTGEMYGQPTRTNGKEYYLVRVTKWTDRSKDAQEETKKCFYFHLDIRDVVMEKLKSEEWQKMLFQHNDNECFTELPTVLR